MAGHRSASTSKNSAAGSKVQAGPAGRTNIKMVKRIREDAVGHGQKVFIMLGHSRKYEDAITVEWSFDAAVKAGIYEFGAIARRFSLSPRRSHDRGRTVLIGKAWNRRASKLECASRPGQHASSLIALFTSKAR